MARPNSGEHHAVRFGSQVYNSLVLADRGSSRHRLELARIGAGEMTRTDAIIRSVVALLESRRRELDAATDLVAVDLELRFSPECLEPRTVIDQIRRERRREWREPAYTKR